MPVEGCLNQKNIKNYLNPIHLPISKFVNLCSIVSLPDEKKILSDSLFFYGKKEISEALMDLTTRKDGARMYSIQNSKNWSRWIDIMGKDWVNKHNK